LKPGLSWTNKLLVDGTIAVLGPVIPDIIYLANDGVNVIADVADGPPNGNWNLLTSTNVALPLPNWTTNASGVFDGTGYAVITNAIDFGEPQRFFRVQVP
jgi:hypothetical protein